MSIRYENRQFWRRVESGGEMDFAASGPQQAVTEVLATGEVVVRAVSINAEGEVVGEPFLVGVAPAGHTPIRVRHGSGLALIFTFPKAVECWVYDDREDHQAEAPVGVSFTVFEMPGHLMNDPVQVIIHRDNVRKALQRQVDQANPQPDVIGDLQQQIKRLSERLEKAEKPDEAPDNGGAEQSAES